MHSSILCSVHLSFVSLYIGFLLQVPFIGWTGDMPLAGGFLQSLLQSAAKPFVSFFMKRTGQQFFMHDAGNGQTPLLVSYRLHLAADLLYCHSIAWAGPVAHGPACTWFRIQSVWCDICWCYRLCAITICAVTSQASSVEGFLSHNHGVPLSDTLLYCHQLQVQ